MSWNFLKIFGWESAEATRAGGSAIGVCAPPAREAEADPIPWNELQYWIVMDSAFPRAWKPTRAFWLHLERFNRCRRFW